MEELSLTLSLCLTLSLTHSLTLALSLSLSLTLSLSHSLTHSLTHPLSLSLSLLHAAGNEPVDDAQQGHSDIACESRAAVERIWHTQDSKGQIMVLAFRQKSLKPFKLFPLDPEA